MCEAQHSDLAMEEQTVYTERELPTSQLQFLITEYSADPQQVAVSEEREALTFHRTSTLFLVRHRCRQPC